MRNCVLAFFENRTKGWTCMAIYTIAQYQVRPSGVDTVKQAIKKFIPHVQSKEPGTRMYLAWQSKDDPTRFVHFFTFDDEAARTTPGQPEAVKRFEAAYHPELVGGNVVFIAANCIKICRVGCPRERRRQPQCL
jgi:quinol monooxygenase YgiN